MTVARGAMGVRRAGLAAAAALALLTAARLPAAWRSGNALNHASGVWLALGDDLAHGTLYRPLHAAAGYGGTRYFPLVFALHAGLVRAGVPLIEAGEALALAAGLLLVVGIGALLRAAGAPRADAAAFAALALAGFAGQHALAAARGDLLPVALCALGLALVARGRIGPAAAALVLAFAAKPTALAAAAAALGALGLRGERRAALRLAVLTGCGAGGALLATEALSSGRFLAGLSAAASAGAGPDTLLAAPVRLVEEAAREDPAGLLVAALAAAVLAAALPGLLRGARRREKDPRLLPALWVLSAWAALLVIYASPGTGVNHLVELEAASAALLGAAALRGGRSGAAARGACAVAAAAGILVAAGLWRADRASSRRSELEAVVRALPPAGPIVSEDPLVPLLAGASPLLLDPFTLRVASARRPALSAPLAAALRRGAFPAVVLLADLDAPGADAWYARGNLGLPLVREIRRGYRAAGVFGRYHLYLPLELRAQGQPDEAASWRAGVPPLQLTGDPR